MIQKAQTSEKNSNPNYDHIYYTYPKDYRGYWFVFDCGIIDHWLIEQTSLLGIPVPILTTTTMTVMMINKTSYITIISIFAGNSLSRLEVPRT